MLTQLTGLLLLTDAGRPTAFTAVLTVYGYRVALDAYEFGDLSTTTLRFPMWIYYACLPVGAGLMTLRYLVLVGLMATGFRVPDRKH